MKQGFTLIELLVVIAIIGILASFLFVTMKPSDQTNKAKDALVRQAVDSLRIEVMNYFSKNNNSFLDAEDDNKIKNVINAVDGMEFDSTEDKWVAKAPLTTGKEFCRDHKGKASEKENQDITDFLCD